MRSVKVCNLMCRDGCYYFKKRPVIRCCGFLPKDESTQPVIKGKVDQPGLSRTGALDRACEENGGFLKGEISLHRIVTATARFIASHLTESLLKRAWRVTGIDCSTDSYPRELKEKNIPQLLNFENCNFARENLLQLYVRSLLKDLDYLFHMAPQTGVRTSWGEDFQSYVSHNILVTPRPLLVKSTASEGVEGK